MKKKYTVIKHVRLVDGTGAPAIENATFVFFNGDTIADDRLVYCGPAETYDSAVTADGTVFELDLSDSTYTVMPGLINTHVHLSLELPYLSYYVDKFGDAYRAMVTYRRACEALLCGVTTIRGVGNADTSEIAVRNAINKGMFGGPQIITCGSALCPHAGHGHNTPRNVECSGPDEFIRGLRSQLAQGVDQIKLMYTGGLAGAYEGTLDIQMTEDEVRACIEVAHNNSKKIAAHLSNDLAIAQAVRLGLDSVEHAYTLTDETCRMMAEKGTFLTPTLIVSHCDEYLKKHGSPDWQLNKQKAAAAEHINSCRRAVQAGVTICTGTDLLPSDPIDGTTPTIRETELLVEDVGMTPLQAIRAATYNGADLCGILKETGSLEPGKLGDFIIVEGKPDQNIRDLRNIRLISKGCRLVKSTLPAITKQNFNPMMAGMPCDGGTFRLW